MRLLACSHANPEGRATSSLTYALKLTMLAASGPTNMERHMKPIRTAAVVLGGIISLLIIFVVACCVALGPAYMYRYVFWNVSDIEDYKRFPSHAIHNEPPAFRFRENPQEDAVRAAFEGARYAYGGDSRTVGSLEEFLESTGTTAFIVIKDDSILYERYFNGYSRDSINTSFSVAKSFASALIGIAIDEGHVDGVDDPIVKYLPELKGRGLDSITIRNLLMMASGLRYDETSLPADIDFPWGADVATYYSLDLRKTALAVKREEEPGRHFRYNNYHPLLLGLILERTTGMPVARYLEEKIWKPLDMEFAASWSVDSEESGFEKMESGINARAIDFAKFGRLFLRSGDWDGERIVSERWVLDSVTRDLTTPPDYYSLPGWWTGPLGSDKAYYKYMWYGFDRGDGDYDFFASGHLGQYIYVSPSNSLLIVRNGKRDGEIDWWPELFCAAAGKL